jgi:hypothetical protein
MLAISFNKVLDVFPVIYRLGNKNRVLGRALPVVECLGELNSLTNLVGSLS